MHDRNPGEIIMLENVRFHLEEEGSVKDKEGKKVRNRKRSERFCRP